MSSKSMKNATGINVVTTAETVLVVSDAVPFQSPAGEGVCVEGTVNILAGTGTTAVVIAVRRGSTVAGTLIGSRTHTLAAGNTAQLAFSELDTNPVNPSQYVVTVTQTAATGNGTVNYASVVTEPATAAVG